MVEANRSGPRGTDADQTAQDTPTPSDGGAPTAEGPADPADGQRPAAEGPAQAENPDPRDPTGATAADAHTWQPPAPSGPSSWEPGPPAYGASPVDQSTGQSTGQGPDTAAMPAVDAPPYPPQPDHPAAPMGFDPPPYAQPQGGPTPAAPTGGPGPAPTPVGVSDTAVGSPPQQWGSSAPAGPPMAGPNGPMPGQPQPGPNGPMAGPNGPMPPYATAPGPMTGPMAPVPGGPAGPPPIQPAPPGAATSPVTLPTPASRVTSNLMGSLGGIVLVGVGLELTLRFARQTHTMDGLGESINAGPLIWTIIGAILIAASALLARWAAWTPIVPGFILAGLSLWAMVTPFGTGGGQTIADATDWAFDNDEFALFCINGMGLAVGLTLLAAGVAAVLLRAGVRREIRRQLAPR